MSRITEAIVTIATAIIGLAIVAVILGKTSQTGKVITGAGDAFAAIIGAAVKPAAG